MKKTIDKYKDKANDFSESNKTVKNGKEYWEKQPKKKKQYIIGAILACIFIPIIAVTALNASNGGYSVLYPNIDETESKEVMATLQGLSVPTKTNELGEILVPKSEKDRLILELSSHGYPKSAPAYGIFKDNAGFTTTEFEKKTMLLFNLQNNIQNTLKEIDGVDTATVTFVVPEDSGYVLEGSAQKSTASVLVKMEAGKKLSAENVTSIKNLVAYSVPKMKTEDVVVVDGVTGTTMSGSDSAGGSSTSQDSDRLSFEREVESGIKDKVVNLLTLNYPIDKIRVSATAVIDYDKMITEKMDYVPEEGGEGVVGKKDENYTPNLSGEGGIVGEENNTDIPEYLDEDGDGVVDNVNYSGKTEYLVSYIKQQIEKDKAILKSATIAVAVVDDDLDEDTRNSFIESVAKATNVLPENISITAVEGQNEEEETVSQVGAEIMAIVTSPIFLIGIVLVLIIIFAIIMLIKNRKSKDPVIEDSSENDEINRISLQQQIEAEKRKLKKQAEDSKPQESAALGEVKDFAKTNPEITAQLIRTWMKEGDE